MSYQNVSFFRSLESPDLAPIIAYPRASEEEYASRIGELASLGVDSIIGGGRTKIGKLEVLGKGCVGVVVKCKIGDKTCALKIRRTDADRQTMHREADLHRLANLAGAGPRLMAHSRNFIAMEYIDGKSMVDWADDVITENQIRAVATSLLEQCHALDVAGIDHGELSSIDHHAIISGTKATIVDFESASTARKTCNVTAASQSIFQRGAIARKVSSVIGLRDRDRIIEVLRVYKRAQNRANFETVVDALLS